MKDLLERVARLKAQAAQLRAALTLRQTVTDYARARLGELEANEFFRRSPASHKNQVLTDIQAERQTLLDTAAGSLVFSIERDWPALGGEVRRWRELSKAAPSPIAARLARTGGTRLHMTDEVELLTEVLDEQRRVRFAQELEAAPPSLVRDLYAAAIHLDTDEAATLVRYVESRHADGWSGRAPESDEQIGAAVELRKLVANEQAMRVPLELDEAAQTIEDVGRLVNRAVDKLTHKVVPVNLDQRPDLAPLVPHLDAVHEELETAAREAAENVEHEAAAS